MPAINPDVVRLFEQTAQLLEITGGNRFRVNAFHRAAQAIDRLATDLADMGHDDVTAVDGLGEGMAKRIAQFKDTGTIKEHDELLEKVPRGLLDLLDIQGLGPKGVAKLWKEAGVEGVADLKKKALSGELEQLEGFGKKKVQNLLDALDFAQQAAQRANIGRAMPLARWIVDRMRGVRHVKRAEYAGSLRRGRETIGDIDVLVAVADPHAQAVGDAFVQLEVVEDVLAHGKTKCSIRTHEDAGRMQVDLRVVPPDRFGAALLYFTGSKDHNVRLRERARKQDRTLNEYALAELAEDDDGNEAPGDVVAADTEQAVYDALGLAWVPPELREDHGEIKLAEKNELPDLIELGDVKAELHCHTHASDGHWSIRELAAAAVDRGFHSLAVTDHSKSQAQANGLDADRLLEHADAIREVAEEMKGDLAIYAGSEVDILSDGKLDYPDSVLKRLDFVVASPHAALSQDPKKATRRLLKAIDNRYVHVIGHATGRLINRREGLSPDMATLFERAAEKGVAFEINANSYRLDLRDHHARLALDHGVRLSINTDAHGPADFDQLVYGVFTARRAGATAEHVVNAWDRGRLASWIGDRK